jgi:Major Facilitator Superfamily
MTGNPAESAIRKVGRRLIPFLILCYAVNFLDRVNVGFAALAMNEDLGFTPEIFGFGAGIFFVGYILFEVPSNLALHKFGARIWIARIMISWGLVATAMGFITGATSFYALRFLLGVAEAGFFPGIILYLNLTYWFPKAERARIVSLFMTAVPIATVVGGPISGALLGLHGFGGFAGWRWLFIIDGIPAVLLGIIALRFLTDPRPSLFLSRDRALWHRVLDAAGPGDLRPFQSRHRISHRHPLSYRRHRHGHRRPPLRREGRAHLACCAAAVSIGRGVRLVGQCRAASARHAGAVACHARNLRRHRHVLFVAHLDPNRFRRRGRARAHSALDESRDLAIYSLDQPLAGVPPPDIAETFG